jgi:hypothetical protein
MRLTALYGRLIHGTVHGRFDEQDRMMNRQSGKNLSRSLSARAPAQMGMHDQRQRTLGLSLRRLRIHQPLGVRRRVIGGQKTSGLIHAGA